MESKAKVLGGRIEWIDAMRGFTMLIVVWYHVCLNTYCGESYDVFTLFFKTFRMPLFFFISGFIAFRLGEINTSQRFPLLIVMIFSLLLLWYSFPS